MLESKSEGSTAWAIPSLRARSVLYQYGTPYYALSEVFTVAGTNVCGRTAIVADAIVAATPAQDSCATVSPADMAALTELDLPSRPGFYSLKVGDFAGLDSLTTLDLSDTFLQSLPSGAFDGLGGLYELNLSDTSLRSLPSGAFDGLDSLTRLYLNDTSLDSLPGGVFAGLTSLITLDLSDNRLVAKL